MQLFLLTSRPLNRYLKERGVTVIYWTINEEEDLREVIKVRDV